MKLLVTGGLGFIGSNFIRYIFNKYPNYQVTNLDKVTYCGNQENLRDIEKSHNYHFVNGDICNFELVNSLLKKIKPDAIVNFAAESHNSNAAANPGIFFETNVLGTQRLLEAARKNKVPRFHHVSTCEVYGQLALDGQEAFTEDSPYKPRTPYNASKASSDHAVRAYFETFNLPVTISNCGNNYGPFQFPEKLIPLFTTNAIENIPLPIYRQSQNKREWIHVLDHCRAIDLILQKGKIGETYNIGTGIEKSVEEITEIILATLGKPDSLKKYVEDRPGHDTRYLLNSSKINRELGWFPEIDFNSGIVETIKWYVKNREWWEPLKKRLQVQEEKWDGKKD